MFCFHSAHNYAQLEEMLNFVLNHLELKMHPAYEQQQVSMFWSLRATNRELTNRRLLHDDAVGLRDMSTAHAFLGTCRRRAKVDDVGESDLPAS